MGQGGGALRAHTRLHMLLAFKNPLPSLTILLVGPAIIALLLAAQALVVSLQHTPPPRPAPVAVGAIPPCVPAPGSTRPSPAGQVHGCATLLYAPLSPSIERTVDLLMEAGGLPRAHAVSLPGCAGSP